MVQVPEPPGTVPEFLVEYVEEQPTETLRRAVNYLDGDGDYEQAPQRIVEAASLQDDETVAAIASFSRDVVTFVESTDHDTMAEAVAADDGGDDDDDSGDTTALRYGSL
jgi:hypothetical protein